MRPVYKILEIKEEQLIVPQSRQTQLVIFQSPKTDEVISKKISIPNFAKVGDLIRKVEHHFYDVIDEDGEIIWRR